MEKSLPSIPAKRYFAIGEVSELCGVKPHVLRYWEQEFAQLKPMKRRGNRRYYQHHEVLMIRRIRDLLYDQGFTISGARNKLHEIVQVERDKRKAGEVMLTGIDVGDDAADSEFPDMDAVDSGFSDFEDSTPEADHNLHANQHVPWMQVRRELFEIRELLLSV
jgi:DNA-binding transcriptional MerR regulator